MFTVNNLFKSYGPATVLVDISFGMNLGERVGLIGANGSGKSTLLKVIAGIESADSGQVSHSSSVRVGYLPQAVSDIGGRTIGSLLTEAVEEIREVESRLQQLEAIMASDDGDRFPETLPEYSRLSDQYEKLGGNDINEAIEKTIAGLGIASIDRSRTINSLSGGEKTRLSLAITLLPSPNLLLLDEPTNNLDFQSLEWLERYLTRHKGAVLIASHDRQFLNNVVNVVFELDEYSHRLKRYSGNYDDYTTVRETEKIKWEEDYRRQQEEIKGLRKTIGSMNPANKRKPKIARDGDKFVPHFKEQRVQLAVSRAVRNAEERLSRIEIDPVPKPPKPLLFKPADKLQPIRSSQVIMVNHVNKSYGIKSVLHKIEFSIGRDVRIVITGPNGSGKSTLLKLIAGKENADSGQVTFSPGVRIGFLPQEPEMDDPKQSILEYIRRGLVGYEEDFVFDLVTCGLFRYEELKKSLGQLSMGQVRKLQIARVIAEEPNVLILDEPTNHVSLDVLESFERALAVFEGPILSVSHDRRYIEKFGKVVWELMDGKLLTQVSR
jgi:macrolide transport system ATP-binding/permease protein